MAASLLKGKLVAVTGAASGIGRATAELLAQHGVLLSLCDINESELEAFKSELKKEDSEIFTCAVDPVWGAANIAGTTGPSFFQERGSIRNLSDDEFHDLMNINLTGVFNCVRVQLPYIQIGRNGRNGGSIVNMASLAGIKGVPLGCPYTVAKHGIIGLTRTLAREEGKRAIRVNAIAPGVIITPQSARVTPTAQDVRSWCPDPALDRAGDAVEVAETIAFLLSSAGSYVNGTGYLED
ncbi:short chain dehydrogenase reductase family oxidoreductase [Trichoderma arundinaceum]|uniref:Short chain dehydrogenase reductase family oxidoreductase n=1 Tax=Trichoderma arundinaceum TaxID=490622 RepID=A0A395N7N7_TRIAR|nr:short chain dehydrogenase reductase family oxidoreductase [Trichoderma arundinaceum]